MYNVRPFSGPQFDKNHSKYVAKYDHICAICGRPVNEPQHFAAVDDSNGEYTFKAPGTPTELGTWAIGNDCHKRHATK